MIPRSYSDNSEYRDNKSPYTTPTSNTATRRLTPYSLGSSRKSVRAFKTHSILMQFVDVDAGESSPEVSSLVMEDDSSTFDSLFLENCSTVFKPFNGHVAKQKGLAHVIVSGKTKTNDNAATQVSADTLISNLHVMFLIVHTIQFILTHNEINAITPPQAPSSPTIPGSPTNRSKAMTTPPRSHFTYDVLSIKSYEVKATLTGEKGIYSKSIQSPEISVQIHEISNQIFSDLFISLCSSSFIDYDGNEAISRGLSKVIVRGVDLSGSKHSESVKGETTVGMLKYMFETIECLEFKCKSGLDDASQSNETDRTPVLRSLTTPNVLGWTVTKPITHHPIIQLVDPDNKILTVDKQINLSDATNISFSDLFFVHCTSTFNNHGGKDAMSRGLLRVLLTGISVSEGILLEGGVQKEGGIRICEEFSHKSKVSSIKKLFETLECVSFHLKQFESEVGLETPKQFSLPAARKNDTISARYIKLVRLYNKDEPIHVNQIEVYDDRGSRFNPVGANLSPQFGKANNYGAKFVYDGNYDEVDSNNKAAIAHTTASADAYLELDLGKDNVISKVLIFNRLINSAAIIGTVLLLTNNAGAVVFICPIITSMRLIQIRTVPRKLLPRKSITPMEPTVPTIPKTIPPEPSIDDVIDMQRELESYQAGLMSTEEAKRKPWWMWFFSSCVGAGKNPEDLVGIKKHHDDVVSPMAEITEQEDLPHEPKLEKTNIDKPVKVLVECPSEWACAVIGDYEVYQGSKKYAGYTGDAYEGFDSDAIELLGLDTIIV